jgi:Fe-S cluster biogenesis protein NfuA
MEASAAQEATLRDRVSEVLDRVRVFLQRDGGDVELVDVTDDGVVRVRLQGACKGCPMSQITISRGVEAALKEEIPEVDHVEPVSD